MWDSLQRWNMTGGGFDFGHQWIPGAEGVMVRQFPRVDSRKAGSRAWEYYGKYALQEQGSFVLGVGEPFPPPWHGGKSELC